MTDRSPNLPTHDQYLDYRGVNVPANAAAWHDGEFREELIADPVDALHQRFVYRFPMKKLLKVHEYIASWTPLSHGGWTTN
ncbi:BMA_0021/BMA_0022 family TOMM bacteriocin, partial [Burkholderia pseudomallei]